MQLRDLRPISMNGGFNFSHPSLTKTDDNGEKVVTFTINDSTVSGASSSYEVFGFTGERDGGVAPSMVVNAYMDIKETIFSKAINMDGTLTMKFNGTSASQSIYFNGTSDTGIEMAIRANGEALEFYEPEHDNKVHLKIIDDGGVDAFHGFLEGGTRIDTKYLQTSGKGTERPSSPLVGTMFFDTSIGNDAGKPIWFDGHDWVDATGTKV